MEFWSACKLPWGIRWFYWRLWYPSALRRAEKKALKAYLRRD